jgi:hypothetical protein
MMHLACCSMLLFGILGRPLHTYSYFRGLSVLCSYVFLLGIAVLPLWHQRST